MIADDRSANFRTLTSIQRAEIVPARARLWLPHIVGTQCEWLARLQGVHNDIPLWPEWTLDETAGRIETLHHQWQAYLDTTPPPDLKKAVAYKNSHGKTHTNTPADIIHHLLVHSHHYRDQIAAELRAANGTPAISDIIYALRDPDYPRTTVA